MVRKENAMRGNNNYSCTAEKGFMLPSIDAKHSTDKQIKSLYIQPSDSRSFREGRLPQQKLKLPSINNNAGKLWKPMGCFIFQ